MAIKIKDISKLVGGAAELINSFLDEDALDVGRNEDDKRTHVRLKGQSFKQEHLKKMNFGMDFEDENTRVASKSKNVKRIK